MQENQNPLDKDNILMDKDLVWMYQNPIKNLVNLILGLTAGGGAGYYTYSKLMKKNKSQLLKILATLGVSIPTYVITATALMKAQQAAFGFGRFPGRRNRRSRSKVHRRSNRRRATFGFGRSPEHRRRSRRFHPHRSKHKRV